MKTQHPWAASAAIILSLAGSECLAQTSGSFSDVPDHYRIEIGGFRLGSDTVLQLNDGTGGGSAVDFEDTLELPETASRGYVEGYWRLGRRHQVSLGWFRNNRKGPGTTLSRDIVWGDRVFTVGTTVEGEAGTNYFSGVYRFAAFRNDRFEIGPAVGLGYLKVGSTIRTPEREGSANIGHVTGNLGGYFSYWATRRFQIRADGRYILVNPENAEASVTEARGSALYHPWKTVGFGVQYTYSKFRYERDILSRELGGSLRYKGVQVLADFAF